jgi:hypothetical protein
MQFFHPTKKVFTGRGYIIYIKGTLKAYQIESQETEFIEFIQAGTVLKLRLEPVAHQFYLKDCLRWYTSQKVVHYLQ